MSIANKLANFTMGQADVLRKAMGKKKLDVMAEQKELFIAGATKNKIPEDKATRLFDLMAFFAEYGFNRIREERNHGKRTANLECCSTSGRRAVQF